MKRKCRSHFAALASAILLCPLLIHQAEAKNASKPSGLKLPEQVFGSWGRDLDACTESESSGRLHITPKVFEFDGARLTISRIQDIGGGWWRAQGTLREDGSRRSRRTSVEVRLQAQDRLAVRAGAGPDETFQRCRPQQLQG